MGMLLAGAVMPAAGFAQAYPARTIRIIVPFPPGGFADIYGRLIGTRMAETFGHTVLVENRTGAGGNIGTEQLAKSAPDGHTLGMGTIGTHAINAALYPRLAYDPVRDFAPIAFVVEAEGLLVVNAGVPATTVTELIKLARARPGGLNYASAGIGSTGHLAAEIFKHATQTEMTHIPYKGNVPAIQDLLGGSAQVSFATLPTVLPHVRSGRLKAIAVLGSQRSLTLPEIPTVAESAVPGFEVPNWAGLFAPAGTPAAIVEKLHAEVLRILALPELQARMSQEGLRPIPMSAAQFGAFVKAEVVKWGAVVKRVGVTAE
jgi:tripartite-type tricarboxylate transporter receptor subunit TctC